MFSSPTSQLRQWKAGWTCGRGFQCWTELRINTEECRVTQAWTLSWDLLTVWKTLTKFLVETERERDRERPREKEPRRRRKLCTCSVEALIRLDHSLCSIRTLFRSRRTASCFSCSSASLDSSGSCLPVRAVAEGVTCAKPSFSRLHMSHASVTRDECRLLGHFKKRMVFCALLQLAVMSEKKNARRRRRRSRIQEPLWAPTESRRLLLCSCHYLLLCDVNYTSYCFLCGKRRYQKAQAWPWLFMENCIQSEVRRGQRLYTYSGQLVNEISQY